jgi:hypothetical protein
MAFFSAFAKPPPNLAQLKYGYATLAELPVEIYWMMIATCGSDM